MNKRVLVNYYAKLLQKGYDESKIPEDLLEDVKETYKTLPPREFDPETETPAVDALESSKEVKSIEDDKKEEVKEDTVKEQKPEETETTEEETAEETADEIPVEEKLEE